MATRRNVTAAATADNVAAIIKPTTKSDIAPAVPSHVIVKLLFFTFAMIVAPIGTYFLSLDSIFNGNSTFAGATAAIVANVVLISYVVVAMREDQSDAIAAAEKEKKGL